ncbi:RNA polymerase-associated protein RapA [Thalassotalea agarivorans]|uniref:RNA polymerase-associated protein RapA n=1 Tax=Thalassotalea agarivorans TaxID=349064 RepID=A0A1I0FW48_THASX|nr:RNA polymerase-associated protein RapA [Thalassotalea agarivorans]SET61801.1 ATP-dependent helicase HepA [Thalassotalea agarivorans]
MAFQVGQRWISDSESDQGLGTVTAVEGRFVSIVFTATGDMRQYAIKEAPLTRVVFAKDDLVPSHEGWLLRVEQVIESNGVFTYEGKRVDTQEHVALKEVMIDHFIKFNKPQDRLLNGQVDRLDWFRLRKASLAHQYQQQKSHLTGLSGGRVSLIPHQLYIADEVGSRFAPRVLLADEVGLGKTIEAGLIIHQQLVTGRAQRVLVIVPDSLTHQWLVEMLRRFNLAFSIFDESRCQESDQENPFSEEQLVLVNLDFIANNAQWYESIIAEQWDLMVVDEAHHLAWQPEAASIEYLCIEQLAQTIPGVLLLTATPDQLGHQGHFARLKLLDPDRFYDYPTFVEEESHYAEVAAVANAVLARQSLNEAQSNLLTNLLSAKDCELYAASLIADEATQLDAQNKILDQLLDRHGTGRILFRNSRNTIKGFPKRLLHATSLAMPEQYQESINNLFADKAQDEFVASKRFGLLHTPESLYDLESANADWTKIDPRVNYLIELLQQLDKEKLLVICAHAQTAIALEEALRVKEGIRSAVFHEGLSIFERDKAAAYFAQEEDSAQVLLCSEIGSEGRNFQFAHHMVLFDLPTNPDLLEQRIGRLDRIGQKQTINIHVPYFEHSSQALLFNWYQQSLQAFEHTCITGRTVYEKYHKQFTELVVNQDFDGQAAQSFIEQCHQYHLTIKKDLESGRDKLLELNSSGRGKAQALVEEIATIDNDTALPTFMFQVFDVFGVGQDDKSDNAIALQPTEHMLSAQFPCLPEDGTTVTFSRDTALACEDYQLLTWDHPMVTGAMDLVLSDDVGNASIGLLKNPALPAGTFFIECIFTLGATAPAALQLGRYLPTTPIRVLVDKSGNNLADKVPESVLDKQLTPVKKQVALQLVKALKAAVIPLVTKAEAHAEAMTGEIKATAQQAMEEALSQEVSRLKALAEINPSVRQEEIDFIEQKQASLVHYIAKSQLNFEAIRLIVVTE